MPEHIGDEVSSIKAVCKKCGNDDLIIPDKDEEQIVCPKCNTSLGTKGEIGALLMKEAEKEIDSAVKGFQDNLAKNFRGSKTFKFKK